MRAAGDGGQQDLAPGRGIGEGPGDDPWADWLMLAGKRDSEARANHLAELILAGAAVAQLGLDAGGGGEPRQCPI